MSSASLSSKSSQRGSKTSKIYGSTYLPNLVMAQHPSPEELKEYLNEVKALEIYQNLDKSLFSDSYISAFLVGSKLNKAAAIESFTKSIEWRKEFDMLGNEVETDSFSYLNESGKLYWMDALSFDAKPILIWKARYHTPTQGHPEKLKIHARWFAHLIDSARRHGVIRDQFYFVIDRLDSNTRDLALVKHLIPVMSLLFPEHIERILLFPAGMILSGLWTIVKPFVDPVSATKVVILCENDIPNCLKEIIDIKELSSDYGGNTEFEEADTPTSLEKVKRRSKKKVNVDKLNILN